MKLAIATLAALLPVAAMAEMPVPALKPAQAPWLASIIPPRDCQPTAMYLAYAADHDIRMLAWTKLPRIKDVGMVGQLWGTSPDAKDINWAIVVSFDNGVTCTLNKGGGLPEWATRHLDGARA